MNPYVILAAVLCMAGSFLYGTKVGKEHELAKAAETQELIRAVKAEAQLGAAEAIAKNRPIHQTIQKNAETIIREHEILTTCVNPPELERLLDAARRDGKPGAVTPGGDKLPSGSGRGESP